MKFTPKRCWNRAGRSTSPKSSSTVGSSPGGNVASARHTASKAENASGDAADGMSTVDKAKEAASAAGSWVVENSERQRKRIFQLGWDWLAGENRPEGTIHSKESGLSEGEGEATEHHAAPDKTAAEVQRRKEGLTEGNAVDNAESKGGSTGERTTAVSIKSDSNEHAEAAWRRGSLDASVNER